MSRGAHLTLGLALLVALGLLEVVAGDDGLGLGGAALLLLLGALGEPARRGRAPLWRVALDTALPALGAAAGLVVLARGALPGAAAPGLATVAREVGLLGATLLWRTPPALLPLHGLGVLLVLWTSAALAPSPDALQALAALLALVCLAQGLALSRTLEAGSEAATTAGVGVAPLARAPAPSPLPALLAAGLAALPAGLGLALPRPMPAPVEEAAGALAPRLPGPSPIRFAPELRLDEPRGPLSEDETVVARLTAEPEPPTLFLRGAVLPRLTAAGFFPAQGVEPEPVANEEVAVELEVTLTQPQAGYLLVAGRVLGVAGLAVRSAPGGLLVPEGAAYPLSYRASCLLPDPARELGQYPALLDPRWVEVPAALRSPALRALAEEAVQGSSPAERAAAAVHWLGQRCDYDLRVGARGAGAAARLTSFLLQERRGVCTEFAAAMAVLLRLRGDPARVVTGYRVIERDLDDRRVIRVRHAHAWVEVPLQGAGWVPFDPTPTPEPAPPVALTPQQVPGGEAQAAGEELETRLAPDRLAPTVARVVAGLGVLLLLGVVGGGLVARRVARQRRWAAQLGGAGAPGSLWLDQRQRLFALLGARGYVPGGAQTPLAWFRSLPPGSSERERQAQAALGDALALYTRLRFSSLEVGRAEALGAALDGMPR